jgi:Ca-activated chloride channel family protein
MASRAGLLVATLGVTLAPVAASGQGWIEPPPGVDRGFAVERVRGEVHVRIEGRAALVEVSEWFRNDGPRVAEGHYLYPLPGDAVFRGFSLFQGDAELRGEIMDAQQARSIYEEIVRRRADPALIELAGQGLLRARVFPMEPGTERKVTLRYTQLLVRAGDALQLDWVGARPGRASADHERIGAPASQRSPTSFDVLVEGGAFLDPFSPTHVLEVGRAGGKLAVRLSEELVGRLSLFFPLARDAIGVSVAAHRPPGEDGYAMLTLSPGRGAPEQQPRDVTVVLDVSGSMSGEKIAQAREALRFLLGTFEDDDRFRLIAFSNAVHMHSDDWVRATPASIGDARHWVDGLVADGGTNIGAALGEAFRLGSPPERLPLVVFLTDGLPSVGEQSPERLADLAEQRSGRVRVFAFGVGNDVNTHLLDRLGDAGRGSTQYVQPGENVERALGLLALKIRHPVLTDVEIAGAPVRLTEVYPVRLPDVFAGDELVVFARYQGEGDGRLRVRGRQSGRETTFETVASFPRRTEANAYITRLWASRKLGHLMRQLWTEGESESLVQQIKDLAVRYGLPSPYTSYLVQEPDRLVDRPGLPAGVRRDAASPSMASGEAAVRRAQEARSFREAKTVGALKAAEDEVIGRRGLEADATRTVAGRIFRRDDGVWVEVLLDPGLEVIRVKAFSPAWLRMTEALPELRPVLRELTRVTLAGASVAISVGADGIETLNDRALSRLVSRFRGNGGS